MRNAARVLILVFGVAALGGCHRSQPQANASANEDLLLDDNVSNQASNTDIETLPPDESSGTSSSELNKGEDNPDVNDLSNSD
jgi:hypothetical protein